eukprot:gene14363-18334_t
MIIPAMETRRSQLQEAISCSTLPTLPVSRSRASVNHIDDLTYGIADPSALEPMLLTFDGDHPQLEAVFNKLIGVADEQNIAYQKFPGGGSLMFQPNDLMRSFAILHQYVKSPEYKKQRRFEPPFWSSGVRALLSSIGTSKASVDTYMVFFDQSPTIISKAFTHSTVTG